MSIISWRGDTEAHRVGSRKLSLSSVTVWGSLSPLRMKGIKRNLS